MQDFRDDAVEMVLITAKVLFKHAFAAKAYPNGPQFFDGVFEAITMPTGIVHKNNISSKSAK